MEPLCGDPEHQITFCEMYRFKTERIDGYIVNNYIGVVLQVKFQKLRPNAQNRDRIKFPLCSKAVGAKYRSKKEWSWMSSMG